MLEEQQHERETEGGKQLRGNSGEFHWHEDTDLNDGNPYDVIIMSRLQK